MLSLGGNVLFVTVLDINECEDSACRANYTCVNTEGSYWCTCLPGFKHPSPTDNTCEG